MTRFITQKLKLKVNEMKSAVARPQERKSPWISHSAKPLSMLYYDCDRS